MTDRCIPDPEVLVELQNVVARNAAALLEDARLLFEAQRYPRAFALSALAFEELGKAALCLGPLLPGVFEMTDKQFSNEWRPNKFNLYVEPAIGDVRHQKLTSADLDKLYRKLETQGRKVGEGKPPSGLSMRTVRYVHQIIRAALNRPGVSGGSIS